MQLTQSIVSGHLDLSHQQVSQLLRRLGIDLATASLDEIRIAYVRHLRAKASGHGGDEMASERLKLIAAKRQKAEIDLRTRCGELVEADQMRRALVGISAGMRAALERIPDVVAPRLAAETDEHAIAALLAAEIDQVLRDCAAALRAGKFVRDGAV